MPKLVSLRSLLILGSLAAAPLYAQMQVSHPNTTHTTTTAHHHTTSTTSTKSHVWNDSNHLAAVLSDTDNKANLDGPTWNRVSRESNAYADRIYSHTSGASRETAKNLRTHVRAMHEASQKGDFDGARDHARKALPYANRLSEQTAPPSGHQHH